MILSKQHWSGLISALISLYYDYAFIRLGRENVQY